MLRPALVGLLTLAALGAASNEVYLLRSFLGGVGNALVWPTFGLNGTVVVKFGLSLVDVDVDERRSTATLSFWMHEEWDNPALDWSALPELAAVERAMVNPSVIWAPDLMPYNMVLKPDTRWIRGTLAQVERNGHVLFVPVVTFTVRCRRTITEDTEKLSCPLKIGPWTYSVDQVDMQLTDEADIDTSQFVANGEWKVVSTALKREERVYECCPESYVSVEGEVVLQPQHC